MSFYIQAKNYLSSYIQAKIRNLKGYHFMSNIPKISNNKKIANRKLEKLENFIVRH